MIDHADVTKTPPVFASLGPVLVTHPRHGRRGHRPQRRCVRARGARKKAIEVTQRLGRADTSSGADAIPDTLLNTDVEGGHLALLHQRWSTKRPWDSKGISTSAQVCEPSTHQYDYDAQSCHAFLLKHGLVDHFKLNIEANHATLAGHTFQHEPITPRGVTSFHRCQPGRSAAGDTDQFYDLRDATLAMLVVLRSGGSPPRQTSTPTAAQSRTRSV